MAVARECPDFLSVCETIDIYRQQLKTLRRPTCMQSAEDLQFFLAACRRCRPETQQQRLAAECGESSRLAVQVRKRKIRRSHGREQPRFNVDRKWSTFLRNGPGEEHALSRANRSR